MGLGKVKSMGYRFRLLGFESWLCHLLCGIGQLTVSANPTATPLSCGGKLAASLDHLSPGMAQRRRKQDSVAGAKMNVILKIEVVSFAP